VARSDFQRDGANKLKERWQRCPNDLSFHFGILSSFTFENRREREVVVVVVNRDPNTCSFSGMVGVSAGIKVSPTRVGSASIFVRHSSVDAIIGLVYFAVDSSKYR